MLDPASKAQESEGLFDPSFTISGSTERSPRSRAAAASHGPRESGESTPPLWRSTSPVRRHSRYRSLSPASKAQAIARGQRELMEMVRTMPEGCYELSLRDMVEKPWARPSDLDLNQEESLNLNLIGSLVAPKEEAAMAMAMRKRSGSGGKMVRSGSVEAERGGGFLLKMVFPVPARSKRKVRSNSAAKSAASDSSVKSKVSPKPSEDKDWWKRKIPILEESESTRSSSRSSTSSSAGGGGSRRSNRASTTRHGRSMIPSCCSFFRPKKSEHPQPKNIGLQEL